MKFVRNKDLVRAVLVNQPDGSVWCNAPCRIHVPVRYMDVGLGEIGTKITSYGFFPIILNNNVYSVMSVCATWELTPFRTTIVTIDDVEYYEFSFLKNQMVFRNRVLVKVDTIDYPVFNEFFIKGKNSWWTTDDDLSGIFDTAEKHAGSKINKVPEVFEYITSIVTRSVGNKEQYLRQTYKSEADFNLENVAFVPLSSVLYVVKNTLDRLTGADFAKATVGALVNPSKKPNKTERIVRA